MGINKSLIQLFSIFEKGLASLILILMEGIIHFKLSNLIILCEITMFLLFFPLSTQSFTFVSKGVESIPEILTDVFVSIFTLSLMFSM